MEFANVTWSYDRLADGSIHAFAWSADNGSLVAQTEGVDKIEAGKRLYASLARWAKARHGETLTSRNGDRLTADGPLNMRGELSNAL